MTIALNGLIPDGQSITVDPRPWSRGVTRGDGANFAGWLSANSPTLRQMLLHPGVHEITYEGTDATGTSQCIVRWRDARSRP